MKHAKLDEATWESYRILSEKYETLLTKCNEAKSLLRSCGYKEELETIKLLKELFGVR